MAAMHGTDPLVLLLGALGTLALLAVVVGSLHSLVRPLSRVGRLLVYSCTGAILAMAGVGIRFVMIAVRRIPVRDDVGVVGDALIALFVGAGVGALCLGQGRSWGSVPAATKLWLVRPNSDRASGHRPITLP